ncbi:MAG TPA: class I SAM-dependent methyltransferase [Terriglobales bacterium]|nr:class I SAM-dependent methyltransferase [Terriglobales bacterium]
MSRVSHSVKPFLDEDRCLVAGVRAQAWDYTDAETQRLTHNIHRYSGKFIPQIAARAISLLTAPGELVLDPYCGSGTTLLEALLLGRRALGFDLSPLAVLIARTKVTPVSTHDLDQLRQELVQSLAPLRIRADLPPCRSSQKQLTMKSHVRKDPRVSDGWFRKWFRPDILEELVAIDQAIQKITDARTRRVAGVALSNILRRSSNAHSGYPNVMFHKDVPRRSLPLNPFFHELDRICDMVASLETAKAQWQDARVELGNAASLPLEDGSVDAIVSHPPYIGSIPYAEYGVLSLKWLGVDPKELDRKLTGGRRQARDVVERFQKDYSRTLHETARVLRPGRHAFFMVGNPIVHGTTVDLAALTIDLANQAGFRLVVREFRKGVNRRANKMGAEQLLFFQKQAESVRFKLGGSRA